MLGTGNFPGLLLFLSKLTFSENCFKNNYQIVKQLGSRSGPTLCQEALDKKPPVRRGSTVEDKCRKDKGHDLWHRPGLLAEFRRIPMSCQATTASTAITANFECIRNAVGYNDWHQNLIIGVHGAWEIPVLLAADQ